MIVVDSSALISLIDKEPQAPAIRARLLAETRCEMSVGNYVEAGTVIADRMGLAPEAALRELDVLLSASHIVLVPLDEAQAREALRARIAFGKSFGHPAKLNYGDSFAYALAKVRGAPLLHVGNDFSHTDIVSAL